MSEIVNNMKRHVQDMLAQIGQNRIGTVVSVNPSAAQVKLTLQPDGVETGWLPVQQISIGNGWGAVWMPTVGDQAVAISDSADADNLIVTGFIYSTAQMPPAAPAGEMWVVHQSGAAFQMHNNGAMDIKAPAGLTITVGGLTWSFTSAGLTLSNGLLVEPHVHSDPQGGNTGPMAG